MVLGNLASVTSGAAMIYPGEAYDARMTLEAVRDERCTALYGVPTMLITILNHPDLDQFDVSSLRTGIMAGAATYMVKGKQYVAVLAGRGGALPLSIGYAIGKARDVPNNPRLLVFALGGKAVLPPSPGATPAAPVPLPDEKAPPEQVAQGKLLFGRYCQ
ncbi:hypothetical protein LTR94_032637, partial [Friedmanniomyces endolithicus]